MVFLLLPIRSDTLRFRKKVHFSHVSFPRRFVSVLVAMLTLASLLYWLVVDTDYVFSPCITDECKKYIFVVVSMESILIAFAPPQEYSIRLHSRMCNYCREFIVDRVFTVDASCDQNGRMAAWTTWKRTRFPPCHNERECGWAHFGSS